MARPALILPVAAALILLALAPGASASPGKTSVLADLELTGPVEGDAVVFGADLVLGPGAVVSGDALAVGGCLRIADGASVGRHAVAVFGDVALDPGATVGGRVLAFASLASLARSQDGGRGSLQVDSGLRLLASGGWLLVTTGLAFLFPARLRIGAWSLPALGFRVPALGLLVALTLVASLVAVLGLGPALGVPLVAALMVIFFAGKAVGLTVIGCALGRIVLRRWLHYPLPISLEVFAGMLVLLAARFLPLAGETLWIATAVLALGASVAVLGAAPRSSTADSLAP
jgi:hypothetical protein